MQGDTSSNLFYFVSNIGELYVPTEYRDVVFARGRVKLFAHRDLRHLNRIFTHIRHGGVAVAEGQWEQITAVMDYIQRHKQDLVQQSSPKSRDRDASRGNAVGRALKEALSRLACWADADGILRVEPAPILPDLLAFAGEPMGANQGKPFLLPLIKIQQIQEALAETYPIRALNVSLVASENVLAPRSQETIECFQEALRHVRQSEASAITVADIGCGSGCLTLLARQELGDQAEVSASDLLPEAIATTNLNIQRLLPNSNGITVMPAGDLFDPFSGHQFDMVIFNAPWVVARVRNRAELAIHDEKQETVRRFFAQVSDFLKPDGVVLLGYADASGPKAIANLEAIIAEAGFKVDALFNRRVATHRSKRKWEQIRVSVLCRK